MSGPNSKAPGSAGGYLLLLPLFPGYLFIEVVLQWRSPYRSLGVCGVVKSGHAAAVVPDAMIDDIRKRERDGAVELRRLRTGSRVRILSGPLRGHLGLCASMNGAQRVSVLLNFLGGQHEVKLRSDAVEPVDSEDSSSRRAATGMFGKTLMYWRFES